MTRRDFTPALGRFASVRFYDLAASVTRERAWRKLVVEHIAARDDDLVVDVGCGTGTQALLLRADNSRTRIIGVDPDPDALSIAERKCATSGIELRQGMGDELEAVVGAGTASVIASSLMFHHCPMAMKRAVLASMRAVLKPGGRLVIADFGRQRTALMRTAFRIIELADGAETTRPNAEGVLPSLISEAGFRDVREAEVVPTPTGTISIYVAAV